MSDSIETNVNTAKCLRAVAETLDRARQTAMVFNAKSTDRHIEMAQGVLRVLANSIEFDGEHQFLVLDIKHALAIPGR